MIIRRERAPDRPEVLALIQAAFGEQIQTRLLRALYATREYLPEYSLVAETDQGEILGYVIATRAWIGDIPVLSLGPMGVLPNWQGQGIGSALLTALIAASNAAKETTIVLLGGDDCYARFGFVPADSLGIGSADKSWGSAFMALRLAGYHPGIRGLFRSR